MHLLSFRSLPCRYYAHTSIVGEHLIGFLLTSTYNGASFFRYRTLYLVFLLLIYILISDVIKHQVRSVEVELNEHYGNAMSRPISNMISLDFFFLCIHGFKVRIRQKAIFSQ